MKSIDKLRALPYTSSMSNTFLNLHYHLIFSTKDRTPLLSSSIQPEVYEYIGGIIRSLGGSCIEIGGTEDHIHILCRLKADIAVSDSMRQIKGSTSRWINEQKLVDTKFAWQSGYAAFAVSDSVIPQIVEYIKTQEKHHEKLTFKDELRKYLTAQGLPFDERYL